MVLLNRADDIRLGDVKVLEVYKGTVKVWPWLAPKPPAITNTYGAVGGTSSITVSWASQPQATAGYIVYRDGVQVAFLPPGTNSWTNTGLTPNTQYTYRVAGVSESGVGPLGNQVSVRTASVPIPVLSLTPSSTSVEVYFTTVTFTLAVTANRGEGSYMLQRQLPNQGWADLAAMPSGPDAPIAIPNAIPGGTPSGYVNFRVLYTGSGAQAGISAYSPSVAVYGSYRARPGEQFFGGYEGVSPHIAEINDPSVFMMGWAGWNHRVEMNIPPALGALVASMTFEVSDSQGFSCTGDKTNPYIGWWTATTPPEQQGGGPRGPVGMVDSGQGYWYANNVLQDFSPFAWRLQGQVTCRDPVWGIGLNTLIGIRVKVTWIDGHTPTTIWGTGSFMGEPTISFG
jgi:hypothetical protein